MRFCLSCGIAIAPDRLPDGFSPITIRATRKVPRRKDPSENCWMHIMTALPSQLPPPQEQLLLHELRVSRCCTFQRQGGQSGADRGGGASPPLCGGPSRSAGAGTWDPHGRGGISSQAVPLDQAIQAESEENRSCPRGPLFMA